MLIATCTLLLAAQAVETTPIGLEYWPRDAHAARLAEDLRVVEGIDPKELARWHDLVASRPHAAGTPGDAKLIQELGAAFTSMGLEVEVHPFHTYLSRPKSARLQVLSPSPIEVSLSEGVLPGDPFSKDLETMVAEAKNAELLRTGWNAYSGSGDVTGEVVYANYGRREDFLKLKDLGVDCTGKIVMARYGGNFRGYKAKYAEEAGAAGLIIFTDPADSGYGRGLESPEGGWANCNQIQRGSLKTLPYSGDPLTPGVEATKDAERLDPASVALPKIPVQPIGWLAATQIMAPMRGGSVPADWQGGMPFRYRLSGGKDLRVRLQVEQTREILETANVLATLPGTESKPGDPGIIIGCHHDAWIYGANDPTSGLIGVLESARVLTRLAKERGAPRRTITFAAWGAEEHGIIGSTEWVEGHRQRIIDGGTLYINLDAAASGLRLGVSASPALTRLFAGAASRVPQPNGKDGAEGTALDAWRGVAVPGSLPTVGFLGGGSDHVSFLALCSLPSASVSARGAPGTAYHSLYDDLSWYRRVVGEDYASAALVTSITALAADRAARAPLPPFDLALPAKALADTGRRLFRRHTRLFQELSSLDPVIARAVTQTQLASDTEAALKGAIEAGLSGAQRSQIEGLLHGIERAWLDEAGLPGRPWYRNLYAAPDETSGYASWPLPGLQKAALEQDAKIATSSIQALNGVLERREAALRGILAALRPRDGSGADPAQAGNSAGQGGQ